MMTKVSGYVVGAALLFSLMAVVGCRTKADGGKDGIDQAFVTIREARERAETVVPRVKDKFKGNETDERYTAARKLYDDAKAVNNAWVGLLKEKIQGNQPMTTAAFEKQSQAAEDAIRAFLLKADEVTGTGAGTAAPALPGWGDVLDKLVDGGIKIWKAAVDMKQEKRREMAERIESELKWATWEQVGQ